MSKQYYLVKTKTYFIDPHGTPDSAGKSKCVDSGDKADEFYKEWLLAEHNEEEYYQHDEWLKEEELRAGEDGYNSECTSYEIKLITEEQAKEYQEIINQYNKL